MKIRPVILSGGTGIRLWPASRRKTPKQFAALVGNESLFSATLKSVADRTVFTAPLIVGNAEHKFLILEALVQNNISDAVILLEPAGRNTAPATYAAALADSDAPVDMLHLVLPSDHIIKDQDAFFEAITHAVPAADNGSFVLFGIKPTHAETSYGYILSDGETSFPRVQIITSFKEKPDAAMAEDLIQQGALWNSGIFLYAPERLLKEAKNLAPLVLDQIKLAINKAVLDFGCLMLDAEAYEAVPSESFDKAIMEKTQRGAVVPCEMGWSDVGSWRALWQLTEKNDQNNAIIGPATTLEVSNAYIRSDGPTVAVMGLDDIMVIANKDAVLVAPHSRSQDVKALVTALETQHPDKATTHPRVLRPWGSYEGIASGPHFQVRHITIKPGRSLSLQMHHHRAEHWVVITGTAKVECGEIEKLINPNESIFAPIGTQHRLSNPGTVDLQLIEVQSGDDLGGDDIIRFEDNDGHVENI